MKQDALSLDHLALPVYDAEATLAFYSDVLGLPLLDAFSGDDWGGKRWLMMIYGLGDGRQIALCALEGSRRPRRRAPLQDLPHFAFSARDKTAYAAWKAKLEGAGVSYGEEDHGRQRSLYFDDPNGITWEITAPAGKVSAKPDPAARKSVERWIAARRHRAKLGRRPRP
ncbi:MAG: VOC family protein [Kiloniellales bacterium]